MYASISEAWGSESLVSRVQAPSHQNAEGVTRNAANQPWHSAGNAVPTLSDAQTYQYVRFYVQRLFKERGTSAVARLLGPRGCRKVRNLYLLRWNSDDVLHALLILLALVLLYRLLVNKL